MEFTVAAPRAYNPQAECGRVAEHRDEAGRVKRVQEKLNRLGFKVGRPDGVAGPTTRKGISGFIETYALSLLSEVTLFLEQHLDCVAATGMPFHAAK